MNTTRQHIIILMSFVIMIVLPGCNSISSPSAEFVPTPVRSNQAVVVESPNPAYSLAQATIDVGQNQLLGLSQKSTQVSLDMAQAANSAAQSTRDASQRQKMDLAYQSTVVSLNIAQAAATQKFIRQQTELAGNATSDAQSSSATAANFAFLINVTQTAQVMAVENTQVAQTAMAEDARMAYPITATAQAQLVMDAQATQTAAWMAYLMTRPLTTTPFAITKAALLLQEYGHEQQSFSDRIVSPLIPIVGVLDAMLIVLAIILAYRRFMSMPVLHPVWPGRRRLVSHSMIIDGVAIDPEHTLLKLTQSNQTVANPPRLPGENKPQVEIVNAAEAPVADWISEVEQQAVKSRSTR